MEPSRLDRNREGTALPGPLALSPTFGRHVICPMMIARARIRPGSHLETGEHHAINPGPTGDGRSDEASTDCCAENWRRRRPTNRRWSPGARSRAMDLKRIRGAPRGRQHAALADPRDRRRTRSFVGAWGAWAGHGRGAAGALGPRTAAQALKQGEEFGVRIRVSTAERSSAERPQVAGPQLPPAAHREHIATLERIIDIL